MDTIWEMPAHTRAKHLVLEGYLKAWFNILARSSRFARLVYFDGFAGPGRYVGGEQGSPLLAFDAATAVHGSTGQAICLFFVERDADREAHLRQEIDGRKGDSKLDVRIANSTAAEKLEQLVDWLERQPKATRTPVFAFIDPFGIAGAPMSLLRRLLDQPACEVFITLMLDTVRRFWTTSEKRDHVLALMGRKDALDVLGNAHDKLEATRSMYVDELREHARFVRAFRMRNHVGTDIYDLVFATNNAKGHAEMKRAMWRVDKSGLYEFSGHEDVGQMRLQIPHDRLLAERLLGHFRGRTVGGNRVAEFVADDTIYLPRHKTAALKLLESEGVDGEFISVRAEQLSGRPRRSSTFPDLCVIEFPGAEDTSEEG